MVNCYRLSPIKGIKMHYATLIISDDPNFDTIANLLDPYQEEAKPEYMKFFDRTEEFHEKWQNAIIEKIVTPKGMTYYIWDERFKTKMGELKLPKDHYLKKFKATELFSTLDEYMSELFPYIYRDHEKQKYGQWINPNSKWDYWNIGGRFTGFLTGHNPKENPENYEDCDLCEGTGFRNDDIANKIRHDHKENFNCNACDGSGLKLKHSSQIASKGNQIQVKDFDIDKLTQDNIQKYSEIWNQTIDLDPRTRSLQYGIEKVITKDEFLDRAKILNKINAFILNNQWHQRYHSKWWLDQKKEINKKEWDQKFYKLIKELDPQKWLTIVDCHI